MVGQNKGQKRTACSSLASPFMVRVATARCESFARKHADFTRAHYYKFFYGGIGLRFWLFFWGSGWFHSIVFIMWVLG